MSESSVDLARYQLLIVDDEKNIRFSLAERFKSDFAAVHVAASGADAVKVLDRHPVDLVLLDQNLKETGESGLTILATIRDKWPHVVTIIMTAYGRFEQAVEAAQLGCYQYLSKPLDLDQLALVMTNGLATVQLEREVARLRTIQRQRYRVDLVFAEDSGMAKVVELVKRVSQSATSTVLICGETGVGKELVARMVHVNSPRCDGPFIEVNCSAIHENLLESELFGHERGAFTDARRAKPGLFEMADGGTLFLDEVGETSLQVQAKLLRVLETRRFRRLGGTEDRAVDVRVVAATNRNLGDMVAAKEFREDLFYRLSVIPVDVPPLRERPSDIPLLVNHFIDGFNSEFHMQVASVSEEAMAYLCAHAWPGNVRELRNAIERLMLTIDGTELRLAHVSPEAGGAMRAVASPRAGSSVAPGTEWPFASEGVPTLVELERWGIRRAIETTGNNKTKAAELLGISRQTLRMKLKEADAEDGPSVTGFDSVH